MDIDHGKLRAKGWTAEEIAHAKRVIEDYKQAKKTKGFHERALYVFLLILIILGAVAGTLLIQPFLLITTPTVAAIIIAVSGVLFGLLGSVLVKDIEQLESHHHLIISLVIPVAALIASFLLVRQVANLGSLLDENIHHNPYLLAIIFSVGTLVPYLIALQRKKHEAN